ncbi:MAG: hypothetical protein JXX14_05725 [Deltaproteobacteria bacterium]|nr:hypothetical protein [Deltaproteobacteria bacterium]
MNRICKISVFFLFLLTAGTYGTVVAAGEFTDVIDAFDKDNGDPFDLNIRIGYERFQESGNLTRESSNAARLKSGEYYPSYRFGTYEHAQNILNLGIDIGLFHDISFRFDVPVILSDDRSVKTAGDWGETTALFSDRVKSPQRSGVDYLAAGLWWNILDQSRIKEYPTLTAFIEGRFAVGKPLKAACVGTGQALNNCNGETYLDPTTNEDIGFNEDGGISNNLNQVRLGLHFSRRYGFVEPYMGIDGMFGFYKGTDLTMGTGALNTMPPLVGTFDFGVELVPWEVPDDERKFLVIIGGGATYHSEGRTYTPLFDALGTSSYFNDVDYPPGADPNNPADINNDGVTDTTPGSAEQEALQAWNGMTDIENFAELYGRLDFVIQPAKYVKFNLGFKAGHKSEHFITKTDQCPLGSVVDGICQDYNPGHRPILDDPGFRFRSERTFVWSLFLDATAQF